MVFLVFALSTGMTIHYWVHSDNVLYTWPVYLTVSVLSSLGMQLLDIKSLAKVEISHLNETENKHVADGLAWSYYFGYLKLILPGMLKTINNAQGPDYRINDVDFREKIAVPKFFVIIPKNCYCYDAFVEVDKRISVVSSLPSQKINRGGVLERVYKNTLYCIQLEGKPPEYVIMEYATPLLTIHDMSRESDAALDKNDLNEQVVLFYRKLQAILKSDPKCRNQYQLVLVSDVHDNLADVIYKELNK